MEIRFNKTGKERKELVHAIAEIIGAQAIYKGVPSCNYEVDYYTINREGTLTFDDSADSSEVEYLVEQLLERGFEAEVEIAEEANDAGRTSISLPVDHFTDEALENLNNLVEQKGTLMKRAFLTESLPIEKDEEKVSFPWFPEIEQPEDLQAYATFIQKVVEMAKTQKRISVKKKEIVNEKYEFRCFLLRLGMIGNEYKAARKVLLRNLSGSAAFKAGTKKGGEEA